MAEEGGRKSGKFIVVCTTVDVCYTPMGSSTPPIAYQITSTFIDSSDISSNVFFTKEEAFLYNQSFITKVTGDEAGTCGGIKSGTNISRVDPKTASSTVFANKCQVVRHMDMCFMNKGNTLGLVYFQDVSSKTKIDEAGGASLSEANPDLENLLPEEEKGWKDKFKEWLGDKWAESKDAVNNPAEGIKGAAKGAANIVPQTTEMILKGSYLQSGYTNSNQLLQLSAFYELLGDSASAEKYASLAQEIRPTGIQDADFLSLPKFKLNNSAQAGGDTIFSVATIFTGLAGLVKNASKKITKLFAKNSDDIIEGAAKTVDNLPISKTETPSTPKAGQNKPNVVKKDGVTVTKSWTGRVDYSDIVDHKSVGPGKKFTQTQKKKILQQNMEANDGVLRSDLDGTVLDAPVQSRSGVPANMNQGEVDHVFAKSKGGANSYSNAQILSKTQNLSKGAK